MVFPKALLKGWPLCYVLGVTKEEALGDKSLPGFERHPHYLASNPPTTPGPAERVGSLTRF